MQDGAAVRSPTSECETTVEARQHPEPNRDAPRSWQEIDDLGLLAAMRSGAEAAYAEFFVRFGPMLHGLARRLRLSTGERTALVDEFLGDAAMRLVRITSAMPTALAAYLATSFRRRLALDWRNAARQHEIQRGLLTDLGTGSERVVAETCSAYVVRLARGEEGDTNEDGSGEAGEIGDWTRLRQSLALALLEGATEEERRVLAWRAERMPYREIGQLLGIPEGTARVRAIRLRDRLFGVAKRYISALPTHDGLLLARLLQGRQDAGAAASVRAPPLGAARHGRDEQSKQKPRNPGIRRGPRDE